MSGFLLFMLGGFIGIVAMSFFNASAYDKGFEDGKKTGYKEATYEFEKGEK
jgi:hypothetical protein